MTDEDGVIRLPEIRFKPELFGVKVNDFVHFARCPLILCHDRIYETGNESKKQKQVFAETRAEGMVQHGRIETAVHTKGKELDEIIGFELQCEIERKLMGDTLQDNQIKDVEYFLGMIKNKRIRLSGERKIRSYEHMVTGAPDMFILFPNDSYPKTYPSILQMPFENKAGVFPEMGLDFSDLHLGDRFYPEKLQEGLYLLINPDWDDSRFRFGFLFHGKIRKKGYRARMVILDDSLIDDIKAIAPHVRKIRSRNNPVDEEWVLKNYRDLIPDDGGLCNICSYNEGCCFLSSYSATAKKAEYVI